VTRFSYYVGRDAEPESGGVRIMPLRSDRGQGESRCCVLHGEPHISLHPPELIRYYRNESLILSLTFLSEPICIFQGIGVGYSHLCGINSNLDAICWGDTTKAGQGKDAISMLPKGYKWKVSYLL